MRALWHIAAGVLALLALLEALAWGKWPDFCCEVLKARPVEEVSTPRCPAVGDDVAGDLVRHGYSVQRSFLDGDSIATLLEYQQALNWSNYFMVGYKFPETKELLRRAPKLWPAIQELVKSVQARSDIVVAEGDVPEGTWSASEFLSVDGDDPANSVAFIWHQDSDAYYESQKDYHYLNIYLVLNKSSASEAGLSVVSLEHLRERSPESYARLLGNAVTNWIEKRFEWWGWPNYKIPEGMQFVRSHKFEDRYWLQDFDLMDVACTPEMLAGDLIVMRGDTPHRTQFPMKGQRVALSLRLRNVSGFSVQDMFSGGLVKYARLMVDPDYKAGLALYHASGQTLDFTNITLGVYLAGKAIVAYIYLGYYYRVLLAVVRCNTGWLLGERFCPLASF